MLLDIGTEEIAHVEMLATMIARLLETSPVEAQEDAAKNSLVGAVMGGSRVEDLYQPALIRTLLPSRAFQWIECATADR